jgi:photosystem II stability/assembly factor-like uncharacterized protein
MGRPTRLYLLSALACGLMLAACQAGPSSPETAVPSSEAVPSPTKTSASLPSTLHTQTPQTLTGEPATATPMLPTPVAEPLPRLPAGMGIVIQSIRMIDPSTGWGVAQADDSLDRIVHTSDGGLTWTEVTPPEFVGSPDEPRRASLATSPGTPRAWVVYSGAFDPERGPTSVVVWRTTDAGASWLPSTVIEAPEGSGWFEPLSLGFLGDGTGWLMAAIDAGMMHQYIALYTSRDAGATWTRVLDPYGDQPVHSCPKTGLAFVDASTGWMTRDCGGLIDEVTVITTADGGINWVERPVPPPSGLPEGYAYPYLCTPHSIRMETTVAGTLAVSCFQYLETPAPDGTTKREGPHALYHTEDGGNTWSQREYPGGQLLWLNDSHGWALGRDLYRTADGGGTWQLVHSVGWDGQFSFVDEQHGWAVARNQGEIALVRTEDGGASWSILRPVIGP